MKKLIKLSFMALALLAVASCGQTVEVNNNKNNQSLGGNQNSGNNGGSNNDGNSNTEKPEEISYTVSLVTANGEYIPKEDITVYFSNTYTTESAMIDKETGIATITGLDGRFNVYLDGLSSTYTYDPNIYRVDEAKPHCEIELYRVLKPQNSSTVDGSNLYSKTYKINAQGVYKTDMKAAGTVRYYEFTPSQCGTYRVRSLVNIYADDYNPTLVQYTGSFASKFKGNTYNDGGPEGTFTKNFEYIFEVNSLETGGGVWSWAIQGTPKNNDLSATNPYPLYWMFEKLNDDDPINITPLNMYNAQEMDKFDKFGGKSPNGTGVITPMAENGLLDGSKVMYDEAEGFYYRINPKTGEKLGYLYAYYDAVNPYIDRALCRLEAPDMTDSTRDNNSFSVFLKDDHFENLLIDYQNFVENEYYTLMNSDGLVLVTKELQVFLQRLSNSQRYFADGNGFIEFVSSVYASEEDQWLYNCCYYA